jgi:peptide/nickel transport system substrate-binding protein
MRLRLPIAALALGLAACNAADQSSAASSADGGTVILAPAGDAVDLFPPFVADLTGRTVMDQVFDRLAEINADLTTIGDKSFSPRLASKWEWARDSLSIAFSINPKARWHDGKPVTANDVRYTYRLMANDKIGSVVAPLLSNLDSVTVRDSLTAVVWFKKRTPEQFYDVAYQLAIVPEHVYGGIPDSALRTSDATRKPIGTGRFRFVKWDAGQRLELISDTANYRGRAKLDRIIFAPAAAQTAATQILSGQVDFMEAFPTDRAKDLEASTIARPILIPTAGYIFLAMNSFEPKSRTARHPILSDIRVRRALAMGVDRNAMLQNVFGTTGRIGHGPFPMTMPFADSTLRIPPYDTVAAKALLDSAGWTVGANGMRAKGGRPLKLRMLLLSTSSYRVRYAVLMQEYFRKLGVQVDLDQTDFKTMIERHDAGDFELYIAAFNPDPSPSGTKQNWSTSGIGSHGQNFLRYSNPRVDALLDSATTTFDAAKMKNYASQAFQGIIDDVPAIFLYDITLIYAAHNRLNVATMRLDEWWANLADWSIPPDKRIDRDRIGLRAESCGDASSLGCFNR